MVFVSSIGGLQPSMQVNMTVHKFICVSFKVSFSQ